VFVVVQDHHKTSRVPHATLPEKFWLLSFLSVCCQTGQTWVPVVRARTSGHKEEHDERKKTEMLGDWSEVELVQWLQHACLFALLEGFDPRPTKLQIQSEQDRAARKCC